MLRTPILKGLLGVAAVAALCGGLAARAQAPSTGQGTQPGNPGTAQSGQSGQQGSSGNTGSGTTGSGTTASGAGAAAAAALSKVDQKIITDIALANMAEIETAKLAQNKSQSADVKSYAQKLIDDHTKALTEVQQLAQTKGVTLPTELDKTHKAKADRLSALATDKFDRAYMAQAGVAGHKKTHKLLRNAQAKAKDPDVKALAARIMPTVDEHMKSARDIQAKPAAKKADTPATQPNTAGAPTQ